MNPVDVDSWMELLVWLVLIVVGPGGGVAAALKLRDRREDAKRSERMQESVDLHAQVFDESIAKLEVRLQKRISDTVAPLADQQAENARDLRRIEHKLDVNSARHDKLERDTYAAISRADAVIAKHHPGD